MKFLNKKLYCTKGGFYYNETIGETLVSFGKAMLLLTLLWMPLFVLTGCSRPEPTKVFESYTNLREYAIDKKIVCKSNIFLDRRFKKSSDANYGIIENWSDTYTSYGYKCNNGEILFWNHKI